VVHCSKLTTCNVTCVCVRCHHGARCSPSSNFLDFACTCGLGYTGRLCDEDVDECVVSSPCRNGATCRNTNGSYHCVCAKGYEGRDCVINTDDCASCEYSPCTPLLHCKWTRASTITYKVMQSWFQFHVRMVERVLMELATTLVFVWMDLVASTVR